MNRIHYIAPIGVKEPTARQIIKLSESGAVSYDNSYEMSTKWRSELGEFILSPARDIMFSGSPHYPPLMAKGRIKAGSFQTIVGANSIFSVGRHAGKPVKQILIEDPKYLKYLKSKGQIFCPYMRQCLK